MNNMKIYPIILKNKIVEPIQIENNIKIREISQEERELFGIKDVKYEFKNMGLGYINPVRIPKEINCNFIQMFPKMMFANNIVECSQDVGEEIRILNESFRMIMPTSTQAEAWTRPDGLVFGADGAYIRKGIKHDFLELNVENVKLLKDYYILIKNSYSDEKWSFNEASY